MKMVFSAVFTRREPCCAVWRWHNPTYHQPGPPHTTREMETLTPGQLQPTFRGLHIQSKLCAFSRTPVSASAIAKASAPLVAGHHVRVADADPSVCIGFFKVVIETTNSVFAGSTAWHCMLITSTSLSTTPAITPVLSTSQPQRRLGEDRRRNRRCGGRHCRVGSAGSSDRPCAWQLIEAVASDRMSCATDGPFVLWGPPCGPLCCPSVRSAVLLTYLLQQAWVSVI